MPTRHARPPAVPTLWLMTDPRMGEALWPALARLPRGAGVIFRHYGVPGRRALYDRVRRIARARGLVLVLAGTPRQAIGWRADGVHGVKVGPARLRTVGAHDRAEVMRAARLGADCVLVSPVFATRSHVGGAALGRVRFGMLARGARMPVIALGGVGARAARGLAALGARGWAGIDAFVR
ncbi:thiamine phosphate synthase [Sphingomonas montana]|uniref:thiamine phosphate synthase n=1 Tax=Sphingomonas montana TaxID=1843236 RepID=UPI00096DE89D|nr:thiamine phosphate synthase [Sphingomonas montana]